jgi:hypothetical protein
MTRKVLLTVVASLATLAVLAAPARAVPTLSIFDNNSNSVVIDDNMAGDNNSNAGIVGFSGAVGNWSVNIVNGFSDPILAPAGVAHMNTVSTNIFSAGTVGRTLTIRFTDTDFDPYLGGFSVYTGGTIGGGLVLTYSAYADLGDTAFGTSTLLASLGPFTTGAYSNTLYSAPLGATSPFSVTQEIVLVAGANGSFASYSAEVKPLPEPGSLLLLGSGLTALVLRRRRRQ